MPFSLSLPSFFLLPLHGFRRRMGLSPGRPLYIKVNKALESMASTMSQVYKQNKDEDGFLYMVYASHEYFGGDCIVL